MAVYTTADLLKQMDESGVQCLADVLCWYHGGPTAAAAWLNEQLGTDYDLQQVTSWRRRGVPKRVRWHALACAVAMMCPGDNRVIERVTGVIEQ